MNKTILQTISLQDYVKRLWNHSNTKIPVTIGKGTDTAKPRSKAPYRGNDITRWNIPGSHFNYAVLCLLSSYINAYWLYNRQNQRRYILTYICGYLIYFSTYPDCPDDYFGVACSTTCNCRGPCDDIYGKCLSGQCLGGWDGRDCQTRK